MAEQTREYRGEPKESAIVNSMINRPEVRAVIKQINEQGAGEEVKAERLQRLQELVVLGDKIDAMETEH